MSELVKVGSLWVKKDKNGNQFLSGETVDGTAWIKVFKNRNKKKDGHPDYEVFKTVKGDRPTTPQKKWTPKEDALEPKMPHEQQVMTNEDIPF